MSDCSHEWMYEDAVYGNCGDDDKCTIRRWCRLCGINQHSYATEWQESSIGEGCEFSELPEGHEVSDE